MHVLIDTFDVGIFVVFSSWLPIRISSKPCQRLSLSQQRHGNDFLRLQAMSPEKPEIVFLFSKVSYRTETSFLSFVIICSACACSLF